MRLGPTGSLYGVGIHALLTGAGNLDSDRHILAVRPYLDEAPDALGETDWTVQPQPTRRHGNHRRHLRAINRLGRQPPAHAEMLGKALLTGRADDGIPPGETIDLHNWTVRTGAHLTTREAHEHLRAISRPGRRPQPTTRQEFRRPTELVDTS
ncbi:hypothetical protein ACFYSF_42570 [Streptomyces canus]|uniref:hypothetical protein n=1 Tax=Streptomyces canus TaxID=58343 RepID=UPI0036985BA9